MTESGPAASPFALRSAWGRSLETPLRQFLRTETGSSAVLLAATVAALAWANIDSSGYAAVWGTELSIRIGTTSLADSLQGWVNSGLMTFFFLVAGLEARREFDMGELRDRRRLALPAVVALGGIVVPILLYLAINAGHPSASGWGTAMSTDTAFALGLLALVGRGVPDRVRTYLLTFAIVDDVAGIIVIALVYSSHLDVTALSVGLAILGVVVVARWRGVRSGPAYFLLGLVAWVAFFKSGVDPVVVGLAAGLLAVAYPAARTDLEQASETFRLFREQPTPELAADARESVRTAISPNDRLQQLYHPWTSYVIVPLFALANAGITINGSFLARAFTSPVTLGILVGYVVGKPVGTVGGAWLLTRLSRGHIRPPIGWAAVTGAGVVAGIGFIVSLLIASLAFHGTQLAEAKVGVLSAAACASLLGWLVFRLTAKLPKQLRLRALLGTADTIIDLAVPVDAERDHIRGPEKAPVTLVEYGDFECPYCGQAESVIRALLADYGDLRYVWRHLPLADVHPHATLAAEGSEAASLQGKFWEMHDQLLDHQGALTAKDLVNYAAGIGLDTGRFRRDLRSGAVDPKIIADMDSADLSGVSGTPTFFINGRRYHGAYDIDTISAEVREARARALLESGRLQRTSRSR
ncbi:MAG TPA: Na+/H+ antiporter NhaA [Streptosporangiaceae bacterium]|jgi:Na+/H+ antiporter NhaA|nr:Na+/H+ antiporter NhaA [Streptosporangiaceae bacterium]